MNVTHKGGKLHIDAVNDLDFVLRQIPREIANRQTNLKPTTKVLITLDVDGLVTRTIPFERNSPEGRAAVRLRTAAAERTSGCRLRASRSEPGSRRATPVPLEAGPPGSCRRRRRNRCRPGIFTVEDRWRER